MIKGKACSGGVCEGVVLCGRVGWGNVRQLLFQKIMITARLGVVWFGSAMWGQARKGVDKAWQEVK